MAKKIEDTREGLDTLTKAELDEAIADGYTVLEEMAANEAPSAEDVAAAKGINDLIAAAEARLGEIVAEETALVDEMAAVRERVQARKDAEAAAAEAEKEPENPETDVVTEPVVEVTEPVVEAVESISPAAIAASADAARTALAGRKSAPPKAVDPAKPKVLIRAAADAGVVASGSKLDSLAPVMEIAQHRWSTMSGTDGRMSLGVATFATPFTDDLTVDESMGDEKILSVVDYAASEKRLPNKSLTAAGGWCAPSETIYDLCPGATTEGMFSLPEISVNRGGIRYTEGPDYGPLFSADNILTEAEVLAGTDKTCIEVTCPAFDDVRLDAVYMCVTSPLLTRVGYPELETGFLQQAMVAHQRRISNSLRARVVAAAGTALVAGTLGSIAGGALATVELIAEQQRESRGWSMAETIEAVVPSWFRAALRADYSMRNGIHEQAISDADIASYFAVRGIRVQYIYGWQALPADSVEFPPTVDILIYKAGTFVAGKAPVIKLNAVYDSAMLKENTHIALFFEEGILVLGRCNEAKVVRVPVCVAGRTGIPNVADCLVTGA